MSEKPPKPSLTIEHVIQMAQKIALEHGGHTAMVIADGDLSSAVAHIEQFESTHEARALQLFLLGVVLARNTDIGVLQQAFFISEAWLSVATPDKPPKLPPSKDPQRKEVLIIAQVGVNPPNSQAVAFEMKRDALHGDLIGLEKLAHYEKAHEAEVSNPLLEAFVHGFLGLPPETDEEPIN